MWIYIGWGPSEHGPTIEERKWEEIINCFYFVFDPGKNWLWQVSLRMGSKWRRGPQRHFSWSFRYRLPSLFVLGMNILFCRRFHCCQFYSVSLTRLTFWNIWCLRGGEGRRGQGEIWSFSSFEQKDHSADHGHTFYQGRAKQANWVNVSPKHGPNFKIW